MYLLYNMAEDVLLMAAFADKSSRKKTQAAKWVRHICLRP